ncbi:hypothetical protein [Lysinibacillus sp. UGB7]|uniref:hypothetical protein n=1 Tax=Lysinibacillus TaxID=400634 RepID=UPI003B7FD28B
MVTTPGIGDLRYGTQSNGTKFFTLIVEEITWELVDGIFIKAWDITVPHPVLLFMSTLGIKSVFVLLIAYL